MDAGKRGERVERGKGKRWSKEKRKDKEMKWKCTYALAVCP